MIKSSGGFIFLQEKAENYLKKKKNSGAPQKKGIWYNLQSHSRKWQPPCANFPEFFDSSGQFLIKVFPFLWYFKTKTDVIGKTNVLLCVKKQQKL